MGKIAIHYYPEDKPPPLSDLEEPLCRIVYIPKIYLRGMWLIQIRSDGIRNDNVRNLQIEFGKILYSLSDAGTFEPDCDNIAWKAGQREVSIQNACEYIQCFIEYMIESIGMMSLIYTDRDILHGTFVEISNLSDLCSHIVQLEPFI